MLQYIFERKLLLVIKTVFCFFCFTNDTDLISCTQFSPASVQTLEKGIWTNGIFVSSIGLVCKNVQEYVRNCWAETEQTHIRV